MTLARDGEQIQIEAVAVFLIVSKSHMNVHTMWYLVSPISNCLAQYLIVSCL
jgi:hypothetical protein